VLSATQRLGAPLRWHVNGHKRANIGLRALAMNFSSHTKPAQCLALMNHMDVQYKSLGMISHYKVFEDMHTEY
jgi:hypothetical protein